jgi:hypothetical protein
MNNPIKINPVWTKDLVTRRAIEFVQFRSALRLAGVDYLCDSHTSFQLKCSDGSRDCHAFALDTHVFRDRQRRSRMRSLRHLEAYAS